MNDIKVARSALAHVRPGLRGLTSIRKLLGVAVRPVARSAKIVDAFVEESF